MQLSEPIEAEQHRGTYGAKSAVPTLNRNENYVDKNKNTVEPRRQSKRFCFTSSPRIVIQRIMDPTGGPASILTLVDTTITAIRVIDGLIRTYRNTPADLVALKHQINGLGSQLILLKHVQTALSADNLCMPGSDREHLEQFLQHTSWLFESIRDFLRSRLPKTTKGGRLKWALHDSQKVKGWELDLQRHASNLANIMILLNL